MRREKKTPSQNKNDMRIIQWFLLLALVIDERHRGRERENENREIWLEQIDNDKEDEKKTWDQEKMRFRILSLFLSVHSNWDSALLLFISSSYVREDAENSITDPISLEEYWSIRELTLCVFVWNDKDEVIHWQ